ncbi:MAG: AraC family transcriptional regulator [Prevotella sp.]|nr:AraC family transcriptional regulator [Prevotella sp.]
MIKQKDGFQGEQSVVLPPMVIEIAENDELASSLFVTDIGYYPNATNHYRERKLAINQYVLIYCVDGCGWYKVKGKEYQVSRNQFFILPAGEPHIYGANESWTIYWIHFRGTHASIFADGMQTPQNINVALNSRIRDRISIFEEIFTTLHTGQDIEDLRYASSLLHYFLASMRYLGQFRRTEGTSDTVEAAIHFMQENIENRITLQDVLNYIGYSQSHFSVIFKKKTGESPIAYFNRLKIEYACKLLKETDLKINQICFKIGIEDPFYFSRLFSKTTGMSPSEYRLTTE